MCFQEVLRMIQKMMLNVAFGSDHLGKLELGYLKQQQ
jgi:hypothetical protein